MNQQINPERIVRDFLIIVNNKYPDTSKSVITRKIIKASRTDELKEAREFGKKEKKRLKGIDLRKFRRKIKND